MSHAINLSFIISYIFNIWNKYEYINHITIIEVSLKYYLHFQSIKNISNCAMIDSIISYHLCPFRKVKFHALSQ